MANFQKNGKNVHGMVLPVTLGKPYEIGLWGPLDLRNNTELDVTTKPDNPAVTITPGKMLPGQPVRVLTITGLPPGQTLLEAKDRGGLAWTSVTLDTTPATAATTNTKYTNNPNEVVTTRTSPTLAQVISSLMANWAGLTANGARTLAAQKVAETGSTNCWNWNLGNIKSSKTDVPHMYLRNVWEVEETPEIAQSKAAALGSLGHVATAQEIADHKWSHPAGKAILVYDPPHDQCRFRAFTTLQDGAVGFTDKHKRIAAKNADYLTNVNAGDTAAVAHTLKQERYYSQGEAIYAAAMDRSKKDIDKTLGPIP